MLTLADVEAKLSRHGPAGGSGEFRAVIHTDKGRLTVWKPGSYGTFIELRLHPHGVSMHECTHYCVDLLEAQCLIMGWELTLKETGDATG